MDGDKDKPVPARVRVFRDEARDLVPLNFGPVVAAGRQRIGDESAADGGPQPISEDTHED